MIIDMVNVVKPTKAELRMMKVDNRVFMRVDLNNTIDQDSIIFMEKTNTSEQKTSFVLFFFFSFLFNWVFCTSPDVYDDTFSFVE